MADLNPRFNAARLVLALRQEGVRDPRVMEALEKTPRDLYVPAPFRDSAWENFELPIDCGQSMTRPVTVGKVIEALEIRREHAVLEVGTGSGYPSAVISRLARRVVSLERYRTLVQRARQTHDQLGVLRVELALADGLRGHAAAAPYDRVVLWGTTPAIPKAILEQLAPLAIVVASLSTAEGPEIVKCELMADGSMRRQVLMPSVFTPLQPGIAKEL